MTKVCVAHPLLITSISCCPGGVYSGSRVCAKTAAELPPHFSVRGVPGAVVQ